MSHVRENFKEKIFTGPGPSRFIEDVNEIGKCARCHLNGRYASELGYLLWTCHQCGHDFLANYWAELSGPWGGPPLQDFGTCSNCVYQDDRHDHDPYDEWV